MSNKDYHASEAIGSSLLKKISLKSLLHAINDDFKTSSAMDLGSAIHAAILEPETFSNEFAVSEKFDRRTKAGKIAAAAFEEANAGKTIITEDQKKIVESVRKSVLNHPIASGMLKGAESEYSYFTEIDGINCKCRPDLYHPEHGCLVDLKSCADASKDGFIRACINLGYHIQAAFYLDVFNKANGTDIKEFYFIAVETTKPYAVSTYKMGEVELNLGRAQYKAALGMLKKYKETPEEIDHFGYEEVINEIQFPIWALEKFSA